MVEAQQWRIVELGLADIASDANRMHCAASSSG